MRVENLTNSNGNYVPNQFNIEDKVKSYFQSYETIIAMRDSKGIVIDSNAWNYSVTTSKYLRKWLGMDKKECMRLVAEKRIRVANLNK